MSSTNINVRTETDSLLDIPNEDTKAALAEYEEMKHDKTKYPQFDSFDEILYKNNKG